MSKLPPIYTPTPGSLIGALHDHGLSVAELARDKELDIRPTYSCWLSQEFSPTDPGLRFRRILCFEPHVRGRPPEVVGDIFRALVAVLAVHPDIRSVALPIVSAGDMGYAIAEMLEPLLDAAVRWLEIGLSLERLVIVAHGEDHAVEARRIFAARKTAHEQPAPTAGPGPLDYDVFISYAHQNTQEREALERALLAARPNLRIFVDRHEIEIGASWQQRIYESLEHSRKVVALLSPDYLASTMCKEEWSIASIQSHQGDQKLIFPLYIYDAATGLPAHIQLWNYLDCRPGDLAKIVEASQALLAALDEDAKA